MTALPSVGGAVHLLPLDVRIEVRPGETIMQAALAQGYSWPTTCHGQGTCGVCFVVVEDGKSNLSPVEPLERERIDAVLRRKGPGARLACQARVSGDAIVTKKGVRAPRLEVRP